jgi:hypothetical protein
VRLGYATNRSYDSKVDLDNALACGVRALELRGGSRYDADPGDVPLDDDVSYFLEKTEDMDIVMSIANTRLSGWKEQNDEVAAKMTEDIAKTMMLSSVLGIQAVIVETGQRRSRSHNRLVEDMLANVGAIMVSLAGAIEQMPLPPILIAHEENDAFGGSYKKLRQAVVAMNSVLGKSVIGTCYNTAAAFNDLGSVEAVRTELRDQLRIRDIPFMVRLDAPSLSYRLDMSSWGERMSMVTKTLLHHDVLTIRNTVMRSHHDDLRVLRRWHGTSHDITH